ncbi:MAG: ABC transporter permease [Chthoniobacterales bacterium]
MKDFRYALRQLRQTPGFTIIAVLTLGLGIGANTAIFSVVNGVLLKPLPYAAPERLVKIWTSLPQLDRAPSSPAAYLDWKRDNQVFTNVVAYVGAGFNIRGGDKPERLAGAKIGADFLTMLGREPMLGRGFAREEDESGRGHVALLSYGLWQRRFAGRSDVIGQTLTLNDETYTVVGVMPKDFAFPRRTTEIWTPLAFTDKERAVRDTNYLDVFARLKEGVTIQQASANVIAIQRQNSTRPNTSENGGIKLVPLTEEIVGDVRPVLYLLFGAVAFVLLIACANVTNLFLARTAERQKEIAIRRALGASQSRIVRLLLAESTVLSLLGAVVGLVLALWSIDVLVALKPANLPRLQEIALNKPAFAFAFLLALAVGTAFGVIPALQSAKTEIEPALRETGRTATAGRARNRVRNLLVVSEVALALVLLIGAGLMIRSFARLLSVDPGFNPEHALLADVALPSPKYKSVAETNAFFSQLMPRLESLPGVVAAGGITDLPLYGGSSTGFDIEGRPPAPPGQRPLVDYRVITPGYFRAMQMTLVKGRAFSDADNRDAPGVVIINEVLARQFFPNEDPLGKRLGLSRPNDVREIVGVMHDVKNWGLDAAVKPEAYIPLQQNAADYLGISTALNVVVRTTNAPETYIPPLINQVRALDPDQPVIEAMTLEQYLGESVAQRRFNMLLLGAFAGVALLLAAIGIYGVIAYYVTQRTSEIGIRIALGAKSADIFRLVVIHAMSMTGVGLFVGLAAAFVLTRFMASMLYQISTRDPLIFISLSAILAVVALAAAILPARRAMRVNPITVLRAE